MKSLFHVAHGAEACENRGAWVYHRTRELILCASSAQGNYPLRPARSAGNLQEDSCRLRVSRKPTGLARPLDPISVSTCFHPPCAHEQNIDKT